MQKLCTLCEPDTPVGNGCGGVGPHTISGCRKTTNQGPRTALTVR